jgi:glycosyltransferase involved in cell wall biosynthesis
MPDAFKRANRVYLRWMARFSARRADQIITISESTRQDVIRWLGARPNKVRAIHCGVEPRFKPMRDEARLTTFRTARGLPENFILYLGTIEPRKNLIRLIDAYADLRRRGVTQWPLILAGGRGWHDTPILEHAAQADLGEALQFAGFVPDEEQPLWYNAATLFVYPSEYEGFGLPPLEALACGTPVVASNSSSLPEVVGDAAVLVDPTRSSAIADGIQRVLEDKPLRERLAEAGPEQSKAFTWRRMAEETLAVYRLVMRPS